MSWLSSIGKSFKRAWKTPYGKAAMIVVGGAIAGPAVAKLGGEVGGTWGSLLKTVGDGMAAPAAAIGKGFSSIGMESVGGAITDFTGEVGNASGGWLGDSATKSGGLINGIAGPMEAPGETQGSWTNAKDAAPGADPVAPKGSMSFDDYGNPLKLDGASAPAPASITSGSAAGDQANKAVEALKKTNPKLAEDAAKAGGQQGLIQSALDWVRKNPAALVVGGQMAMGYAQGKAQQDMMNDQRSYDEKQAADARARFQSNMNVSGVKIPGLVGQAINK